MPYDKLASDTRKITKTIFSSLLRNWGKKYKVKLPSRNDFEIKHSSMIVSVKLKTSFIENGEFDIDADTHATFDNLAVINIHLFYDASTRNNLQDLYYELRGVIRHELEHVAQIGHSINEESNYNNLITKQRHKLFGQGKTLDEWTIEENSIINRFNNGSFIDYVIQIAELDAFCRGFYTQACLSRQPVKNIINNYLSDCISLMRLSQSEAVKCKYWIDTRMINIFPISKESV